MGPFLSPTFLEGVPRLSEFCVRSLPHTLDRLLDLIPTGVYTIVSGLSNRRTIIYWRFYGILLVPQLPVMTGDPKFSARTALLHPGNSPPCLIFILL